MFTKLKLWTNEFFRDVKCNMISISSYMVIMPILILLELRQSIDIYIRSGVTYSVADCFVNKYNPIIIN